MQGRAVGPRESP